MGLPGLSAPHFQWHKQVWLQVNNLPVVISSSSSTYVSKVIWKLTLGESAKKQARKLQATLEAAIRNYHSLTYLLTGVMCRATSVAKNDIDNANYDCDNDNDDINTHEASFFLADKPTLQGGPEEPLIPPDNIGCSSPATIDNVNHYIHECQDNDDNAV